MTKLAVPTARLPNDAFLQHWAEAPLDQITPLVWSDYLTDDSAQTGYLLRELVKAQFSQQRRAVVPVSWNDALAGIPDDWCSVFAIGCVARCILWMPPDYRQEQLDDLGELIRDLSVEPFSELAMSRASSAQSRASIVRSRAEGAQSATAAQSRAKAVQGRASAAWSRASVAYSHTSAATSRVNAAWSRAYASCDRVEAAQSRTEAVEGRADRPWSRVNAAWSRAYAAESRWQARWLQTLKEIIGA